MNQKIITITVLLASAFLTSFALVAYVNEPDEDYVLGVHFGGYWPEVNTTWPETSIVPVWNDDTPPTAQELTDWAVEQNANHLVFTPYYGVLFEHNGENISQVDEYLKELAHGLSQYDLKLILMIVSDDASYPDFDNDVSSVAGNLATIALEYENIIIEFDEPDAKDVQEATFIEWVDSVRMVNQKCTITVGLCNIDEVSESEIYWSHVDTVMLIDYYSDDEVLSQHIILWKETISPMPLWAWITTGDRNHKGVNETLRQAEIVHEHTDGIFVFDRGGIWLYSGDSNIHDTGERSKELRELYETWLSVD